jgi:hypothetical protein
MTRTCVDARNYGDSHIKQVSVPLTSSVLESCSRMPMLAAGKRLAPSTRGTAVRLPFGSTVESWLPRPSACLRPRPHAVPRVDGASPSHSAAYSGRNSSSTLPNAARALSCESTAIPPSQTRWMSR